MVHECGDLMDKTLRLSAGRLRLNQRGCLLGKTLELSAGRSGVRIPGRGKSSLKILTVDARVNYPLCLLQCTYQYVHAAASTQLILIVEAGGSLAMLSMPSRRKV